MPMRAAARHASGRPLGDMAGVAETEVSAASDALGRRVDVEQIPVVTQDRDYDATPGVEVIRV
jgi:hypothetical protein